MNTFRKFDPRAFRAGDPGLEPAKVANPAKPDGSAPHRFSSFSRFSSRPAQTLQFGPAENGGPYTTMPEEVGRGQRPGSLNKDDWQVFFAEQAAIAESDGGLSTTEAEASAYECCVIEWLNRHPETSSPGQCAWCGASEKPERILVPFGTERSGHAWLHHECWELWYQRRRSRARQELRRMGVFPAPEDQP